MLYLVDSNHLVHMMWHMARAKAESDTGDKEAMPDPADVLDWFLIRLDNLYEHWLKEGGFRCVAVFDSPGPGFRGIINPDYKANRDTPPEVYVSVKDAQDALANSDEWGMIISPPGYEADDLMSSIAHQHDGRVTIHSPDKDMNQCLTEDVSIIKRSSMEDLGVNSNGWLIGSEFKTETFTLKDFGDKFPFPHDRWVDYQCLVGDVADNIKGAKWTGHVKACHILTLHPETPLCDLNPDEIGLNKRQREAWPDFINRLDDLRRIFTLYNGLDFQI